MKILSLNINILGHKTVQDNLEYGFSWYGKEVELESFRFTDFYKEDLLTRILYKLLTARLPNAGKKDWDFYRFRTELGFSIFTSRFLKKKLKKKSYDIIMLHTQSLAFLSTWVVRKLPLVISIDMTYALLRREHRGVATFTYLPLMWLEQRLFSRANHIISCSEWARKSVIQDYGIRPEKTSHIPYGIPDVKLPESKSKSSNEKVKLLFVGNDVERKGGYELLDIMPELIHLCELTIVSNNRIKHPNAHMASLIQGLAANSPKLLHLFAEADLFVLPTKEDVYGLVYIEAMRAGLPLIGTDIMGVTELVKSHFNGVLIQRGAKDELKQAIQLLSQEDEKRKRFGCNSYEEYLNNHTLEIYLMKIAKVFTNIIL